jgi:hypothetical protein
MVKQQLTLTLCMILILVFTNGIITNNWTGLEKLIELFRFLFSG